MKTLQQKFIEYLHFERQYSAHTVRAYQRDLEQFFKFCEMRYNIDSNDAEQLKKIKHKTIRFWLSDLVRKELKRKSISRKLSSVSGFFKFLQKKDILENNPLSGTVLPKNEKRVTEFVKQKEIENLFESNLFEKNFEASRNRVILELLYGCGLRRAELISLKISDIDFSKQLIKVEGKGGKERFVPFGDNVKEAMNQYFGHRREKGFELQNSLILTNSGKSAYPKLIYRIVKQYLSKVCSLERASPHVLRHSYATHLLEEGADLNAVKELLGHSSLASTEVYLHSTLKRLKSVYKQAHPKSNMK